MNSDKYIFRKKIKFRRKSKRRLSIEAFLMFFASLFLVLMNYLIPKKNLLLQNIPSTLNKSFVLLNDLFSNLFEILLVIFIFISWIFALVLLVGSFYRISRIIRRKKKLVSFK